MTIIGTNLNVPNGKQKCGLGEALIEAKVSQIIKDM